MGTIAERIKRFFAFKSIASRILLSLTVCGILLLVSTEYILTDKLKDLETKLIEEKLTSDINYLQDLIDSNIGGDGMWESKGGLLYYNGVVIGNGTQYLGNFRPFIECEKKTGTFSYAFLKVGDEGLRHTGDDVTGYDQGHFMRVAGSTKDATGKSIVGTYIDKKVADVLDETGEYSGEANVAGVNTYCVYKTLKDESGNTVGALVVGRSVEEMRAQYTEAGRSAFWMILVILLLIVIGLGTIISRWIKAISVMKKYLDRITSGELPEDPLVVGNKDEMALMAQSINEMNDSLKEKERIGAELSLATDIQANMLPSIFPPFPDHNEFDIFATMTPAKEVGGDFYDFFMLDEKHLAVVIADVSGKGVPAALFMVIAKTLIKNHAQLGMAPCDVFTKVNQMLCEGNEAGLFVTAWMGVIDIETGLLTYVNAGHNPPMIKLADGGFEYLRSRAGFVLAGMDGFKYRQNELQMAPGDKLFLYTDGVTEATDAHKELYGEDRLKDYLNAHTNDSVADTLHGLKANIDEFVGEAEQFDDITMLIFDYQRNGDKDNMIVREFAADDSELENITAFVEEELEKIDCPMKIVMQITVAVEEIFVNIAHYAYPEAKGTMTFGISTDNGRIVMRFADSGVEFDPLAKEDPDITLAAEERGVGGLGIYMVKKTMNDVKYERKDHKNILTLTKEIG